MTCNLDLNWGLWFDRSVWSYALQNLLPDRRTIQNLNFRESLSLYHGWGACPPTHKPAMDAALLYKEPSQGPTVQPHTNTVSCCTLLTDNVSHHKDLCRMQSHTTAIYHIVNFFKQYCITYLKETSGVLRFISLV